MLYLLGGPPRCGKTTLARRIAAARGIGWFSTDTLRDVVDMLIPLYAAGGIGRPHGAEADLLFPYLERTVQSCAYLADDYVIEGVGFFPRHAVALAASSELRVVFVGMSAVDLSSVLEHEGRNTWHRGLAAEELAQVPAWIERWSDEIRVECEYFGLDYVDLAPDFAEGRRRAERLLAGAS